MKKIILLALVSTLFATSSAFAECSEEVVKQEVLDSIYMPLQGVKKTITNLKMSGVSEITKGNGAPYYQILFSYDMTMVFNDGEIEGGTVSMVGIHQVDKATCNLIEGMAESVGSVE